jgi:hypothetical protein
MAILLDILAGGVVDGSGDPLSSGRVYVYELGTTTKVNVYQDADLSVLHANPLTLDAAGKAEAYVENSVRLVIESSAGALINDIDSSGELSALSGDVTLGTTSSNELDINSRLVSDIIPKTDSTYDIGSSTFAWAEGHFDDVFVYDDLAVTDDVTIGGDTTITGNVTFSGSMTGNVPLNTKATRDIGLDVSTTTKIKIAWKDGTALSSTQVGYATFYSTSNAGQVVTRQLTASQEVTLTGAHWGLDTLGDLTDKKLYIILIDNGSTAILGVTVLAGLASVASANCTTTPASATTKDHILTASTVGANANCTYLGWINADFDDTGNGGGENYWTIQTAVGDLQLGIPGNRADGEPFLRTTGTTVTERGIAISSSCGTGYSNATTSYTDVTNLSVTITTSGRPVVVMLATDGTANDIAGYVGIDKPTATSTNFITGYLKMLRGSTDIGHFELYLGYVATTQTTPTLYVPCGSVLLIDAVAAGTYTYKLQAKAINTDSRVLVVRSVLVAYEL